MQIQKVLIAKDDSDRGQFLADYLNRNGFNAESVSSASEVYENAMLHPFDCLVVDIALDTEAPSGFIKKLRTCGKNTPIMVMLNPDDFINTNFCLNLGVDDYISKTVNPFELHIRLESIFKRNQGHQPIDTKLRCGKLILDYPRRVVINEEGQVIGLTLAEFNVTWALANSDGKVLSRHDLIKAMSFGTAPMSVRAVDILVSRVRKKLGKEAVLTVSGVGYKCGWPVSAL